MDVPEVQFASSDGLSIAWNQWGSGPDLLVVSPLATNVEIVWEHEIYRRFLERLGRHLRVTSFDKRGMGISDRFEGNPTLEQRTGDILAVMDAAGLEKPALLGLSEGGLIAQLFAALHPDRVERLLLANSFPGISSYVAAHTEPDGSFGPLEEKLRLFGRLVETWGREPQFFVDWFAPSQSDNDAFVRWIGRFQRQSATAADLQRQLDNIQGLDTTERMHQITMPTLVLQGVGDLVTPAAAGRSIAESIPGARYIELATADHFLMSAEDWSEIVDLVVEFISGLRPERRTERRFATVVFTDIVASTARTAAAGDDDWCDTLDSHDQIAWDTADRHHGTIVKSTGDGLLARFESPSEAVGFASDFRQGLASIDLRVRCGVHTGEIELRESGDITGVAVNLAARVEQTADDGTIFVSSTVREMLLGGDMRFEDRGEHTLKGFDGAWRLFQLV
ncbi:MAG: adenylate/guanylate cyclase domain-containing protein [Acidimicrobiales bacterium]